MLICSCREKLLLFYYYDFLLLLIVGSQEGGHKAPINLAASGAYDASLDVHLKVEGEVGREEANGERSVEVACATLNRPYLSIIKAIWKKLPPPSSVFPSLVPGSKNRLNKSSKVLANTLQR